VADSTWSCPHCERDLTVEGVRRYYFLVKGESRGPFTLSEVRQYATAESVVSHGEGWVEAREHPDFQGVRWDDEVTLPGSLEGVPHLRWVVAGLMSMVVVGLVVVVVSLVSLQSDLDAPVPAPIVPTPVPPPDDPEAARQIEQHLRSVYGVPGHTPSWLRRVVEIRVRGDELEAVTDAVSPGRDPDALCAVLGGLVDDPATPGAAALQRVAVSNLAGTVLAHRDPDQPCRSGPRGVLIRNGRRDRGHLERR
jgi:hypothetical protein